MARIKARGAKHGGIIQATINAESRPFWRYPSSTEIILQLLAESGTLYSTAQARRSNMPASVCHIIDRKYTGKKWPISALDVLPFA